MKIKVAKVYCTSIYNAALVNGMGVQLCPRLTLMSLKPMTLEWSTLGETDRIIECDTIVDMVRGAGIVNLLTITGTNHVYVMNHNSTDKGQEVQVQGFQTPVKLFSKHHEVFTEDDYMPEPVARQTFAQETLVFEEMDLAELVRLSGAKARNIATLDKQFGLNSGLVKDIDKIEQQVEEMAAAAALMPDISRPPVVQGDDSRYVAVSATDFHNAGMDNGAHLHHVQVVRVAHESAPVWHNSIERDGYVGYWEFARAAIGERLPDSNDDETLLAFVTVKGLKVYVKSADAISPGGRVTIPQLVYEQMEEHAASDTMSFDEANAFNVQHATVPRLAVADEAKGRAN